MSKNKTYRRLIQSREWGKLRRKKLAANPLCELCLSNGITRAAQQVHHIVPIESGRSDGAMRALAFEYSNLQSLCCHCHERVHATNPRANGRAAIQSMIDNFVKKMFGE